jgi:predicted acetyltransferase
MNYEIKKINKKYKKKILKLHNNTFDKTKGEKYWEWRFNNNSLKKPLGNIAIMNNRITSHYMVQPVDYNKNNNSMDIVMSVWTMTDPKHTNKGLMTLLATKTYEDSKDKKYSFVIGFANQNSYSIFIKKFQFKKIKTMVETILNLSNKHKFEKEHKIVEVKLFDKTFTQFYNNNIQLKKKICAPRTSKFLNWRYIDKPTKEYRCYKVVNKEEILIGYFILKKYENKCQIVDFVLNDEQKIYNSVLNKTIEFAKKNKLSKISLWVNGNKKFSRYLQSIGFFEKEMNTYFVIKNLDKSFKNQMTNSDKWYITMGDSDVF